MDELVPQQKSGGVVALQPQTMGEMLEFAKTIASSDMVPKEFRGKPGDIVLAIQHGAELGMKPAQSLQSICVINGKPSIYGDTMLALVMASGLLDSIDEEFLEDREGKTTGATCTVVRRGFEPLERKFTMSHAAKANLTGKPGPWSQYPARMCQMRARAWALRDRFPDILKGMQIREEAEDIDAQFTSVTVQPTTTGERVRARLQAATAVEEAVVEAEAMATRHQKLALAAELERRGINPKDKTGQANLSFWSADETMPWSSMTAAHYDAIMEVLADNDDDQLAAIWAGESSEPFPEPQEEPAAPSAPEEAEAPEIVTEISEPASLFGEEEDDAGFETVSQARAAFIALCKTGERRANTPNEVRQRVVELCPSMLPSGKTLVEMRIADWEEAIGQAKEKWGVA